MHSELEDLNTSPLPTNASVPAPNGRSVGAGPDFLRPVLDLNAPYHGNDNVLIQCVCEPGGGSEAADQANLSSGYFCQSCKRKTPEVGGIGVGTDFHRNSSEEGNGDAFQRTIRPRIVEAEQVPASIPTNGGTLMPPPNSSQGVHPPSGNWTTRLQSNGASAFSSPAVRFHEGGSSRQAENRGSLPNNPTNASRINGIANFVRNISSSSDAARLASHSWSPSMSLAEQYNQRLSEILHSSIANFAEMQSSYPPPNPSTVSIGVQASYYPPLNPGEAPHGGQTSYGPLHPNAATMNPEMVESAAAFSTMPPAPHHTPVYAPIPMRLPAPHHTPVYAPIPMRLPALTQPVQPVYGDHNRSRLVEEVRQSLGLVRGNGGLYIGGMLIFDNSTLYGDHDWEYVDEEEEEGFDEADEDENMRIDVDNMSYEQLLDLQEYIGNVNTGLTEEHILARLRRQIYRSLRMGIPVEEEPCCICREEYLDGEVIGNLDCGHGFHYNCIRQWLVLKNTCPVCKLMALRA